MEVPGGTSKAGQGKATEVIRPSYCAVVLTDRNWLAKIYRRRSVARLRRRIVYMDSRVYGLAIHSVKSSLHFREAQLQSRRLSQHVASLRTRHSFAHEGVSRE